MTLFRDALGEVIRERRNELGYTLRKVSEVERGQKEISSEILEGVAKGLKTDASVLVIEAGLRLASWRIPDSVPISMSEEMRRPQMR
jgi:transcriptional regulator with XRE-family HTH domain